MGFWESLFFWIFACGAVASSVAVVALRNPLYSALALIMDFFFFAGLYGLLSAHLMAVAQVLVYAGAIMVLFLFIIMLLNICWLFIAIPMSMYPPAAAVAMLRRA